MSLAEGVMRCPSVKCRNVLEETLTDVAKLEVKNINCPEGQEKLMQLQAPSTVKKLNRLVCKTFCFDFFFQAQDACI